MAWSQRSNSGLKSRRCRGSWTKMSFRWWTGHEAVEEDGRTSCLVNDRGCRDETKAIVLTSVDDNDATLKVSEASECDVWN